MNEHTFKVIRTAKLYVGTIVMNVDVVQEPKLEYEQYVYVIYEGRIYCVTKDQLK